MNLYRAYERVRSFFRKDALDHEMNDEIAAHLEMAVEENLRRGMPPLEARREAMLRFGTLDGARRAHREARGLPWLDVLMQDLRFTFRTLRRERSFTIIAVLILALGIGANVAVFSVVDTILLRPLPFPHADRLVRLVEKGAGASESNRTYSADATEDYQRQNRSFQSVSGYFAFTGPDNFRLAHSGQPRPVTGILVAENFFETLGVQPSAGRLFRHEEFRQHAPVTALLSYPFWKREFHGDRGVIGKTVDMSDTPVTIVGVLPDSFDFGSVFSPGAKVDLFIPFVMEDFREDGNDLALVGRLKPGVTLAAAQGEADSLFPTLYYSHRHPENGKGYTAQLTDLKQYISGRLHASLIALWAAVGLILLIVCANLSNLLLARAAARGKEFAMRSALGASRARLVRQLMTECLVLSGAGAVLGLALAWGLLAWLAHQGSLALPLLSTVRIDGTALLWIVALAIVTALLFGTVPALRLASGNLQQVLKSSGAGTSEGRQHDRLRSMLVVTEVALACVLLVGAGLLLRSFLHVLDVDLGFEPSQAAAIHVDYSDAIATDAAKRAAVWQEVVRRVSALPGVESAGISDSLPMSRNRSWGIAAKGQAPPSNADYRSIFVYVMSPGYLKAMGMRLVEGRDLTWPDLVNNRAVAIINQATARKLWPGQDPIGRTVVIGGMDAQIVGVIADVRETSAEDSSGLQAYLPSTKFWGPEDAHLVMRTAMQPSALAPSVMSILRQINPGQPASEFRTIQGLVDHAGSPRRFFVYLVSAFGALGLLLASLGIYGVISYSVTRQTQEIGIRMALGASMARVRFDVLRTTLQLAAAGIVVGTVASYGVSRLIASLLYGTEPSDPLTFAAMILLLTAIALIAGYFPARRASRIHPIVALRAS